MIALLRRLWFAWRNPEMVRLPPKNPAEEAYDIRGPARELITNHHGEWVDATHTQLDAAREYALFILAVSRAMKGATPADVADKAARVWYGLEMIE